MANDPFAKLGALDQLLYKKTEPASSSVPKPEGLKPENPRNRFPEKARTRETSNSVPREPEKPGNRLPEKSGQAQSLKTPTPRLPIAQSSIEHDLSQREEYYLSIEELELMETIQKQLR